MTIRVYLSTGEQITILADALPDRLDDSPNSAALAFSACVNAGALIETRSGTFLGFNPAHVVMVRIER